MADSKPLVLVTGASGYIAGHVIKQALEDGYRVRGTVRSLSQPEKYEYLTTMGVELVTANLTSDDGWPEAVADVKYILHVASPFFQTNNEDEMIGPAVNGTRRVLEAATASPTVERVVVTSSCAAVSYGHPRGSKPEGYVFTPTDWSVKENIGAYSKSKTMAEEFVWKFKEENNECKFDVVTVNPAGVIGPLMVPKVGESANIIRQILTKQLPMLPRISLGWVDVRDVALVHVRALTAEDAPGKRLLCAPKSTWLGDVGQLLHDKYSGDGWTPTTNIAPDFVVHMMANFDSTMAVIAPDLGFWRVHDCSETERVIGLEWRDIDQGFYDMVDSMIELDVVEKPAPSRCAIL